jgi:hypothetical protein
VGKKMVVFATTE